jgi:mRNA interferase MazF
MPLLQGEIVLVPVPFTDLSSYRRRPMIVVSNDAYHAATTDFVGVAMTSNPKAEPYSFIIDSGDLLTGALNRPGRVRVDKIYTQSPCSLSSTPTSTTSSVG